MCKEIDGERVSTEFLHTADKLGIPAKVKVLTAKANKDLLESTQPPKGFKNVEDDGENNIGGIAPLSPVGPDCEEQELRPAR